MSSTITWSTFAVHGKDKENLDWTFTGRDASIDPAFRLYVRQTKGRPFRVCYITGWKQLQRVRWPGGDPNLVLNDDDAAWMEIDVPTLEAAQQYIETIWRMQS